MSKYNKQIHTHVALWLFTDTTYIICLAFNVICMYICMYCMAIMEHKKYNCGIANFKSVFLKIHIRTSEPITVPGYKYT